MHKVFYPTLMADSIYDIDLLGLFQSNIRGLILDIDNTLVGHGVEEADDRAVEWLESAQKIGMKAYIVSNNNKKRVIKFTEKLKLPAIYKANKPFKRSYIEAMRMMDLSPEQVAVIGDQIFTDIVGGNTLGMYTILVNPVNAMEPIHIRFKRILEKFVLKRIK